MLNLVTYGLAIVLDLLVLFIGARFLLQPESAATGYGVPSQPSAYLSIKGLRDLSYGIIAGLGHILLTVGPILLFIGLGKRVPASLTTG